MMSSASDPNKTIFFIADVIGEPGVTFLETFLKPLIGKYKPDWVIANAENTHEGRGLNHEIVQRMYDAGVHILTGGNHSFDKWKIFGYMNEDPNLLRPANYPDGNPGKGYGIYSLRGCPYKLGVLNLQGRTFMPDIDDPFSKADALLAEIKKETPAIFVDFHAEATAEKMAMGWYLDGRVSAVIGTHTHTPTADARILPAGTGYLTDAGMTGPFQSVIGMNRKTAIRRFTHGAPQRFTVATKDVRLCGVLTKINMITGVCTSIQPIIYPEFVTSTRTSDTRTTNTLNEENGTE